MDKQSITTAMSDSITEEVSLIAGNLMESGIDSIMNDGLLKDIPFISTVISAFKMGKSIKERHYVKKMAAFIYESNRGVKNEERRLYYKNKLNTDISKSTRELEYILLILDRYFQSEKARMLARIYLKYLDEEIDWLLFAKYAEVIDRFLPGDYNTLQSSERYRTERDIETDSIQRLVANGLVIEDIRKSNIQTDGKGVIMIDDPKMMEKKERVYSRTEFGSLLVSILSNIQEPL